MKWTIINIDCRFVIIMSRQIRVSAGCFGFCLLIPLMVAETYSFIYNIILTNLCQPLGSEIATVYLPNGS